MTHSQLPHAHGDDHSITDFQSVLSHIQPFSVAAELFKQLSDPTRIRIFWLLCHREECVINLSALLGISSPAVSHHLRPLRDCGLIVGKRDGKEVYYRAADTEICRLLHLMVEQVIEVACPQKAGGISHSNTEIIHQVHEYLVEHLNERITIEELSRQFLLNATTLKQLFKEEYGTSIAAHIKEHRMEKAAQLLLGTTDSISEIAKAVGFDSQSRFTTAFKNTYHMLPSEYRRTSSRL